MGSILEHVSAFQEQSVRIKAGHKTDNPVLKIEQMGVAVKDKYLMWRGEKKRD